jgi:radical SAM superfamily enzyme YgiQ (UPF0313 family)
VDVILIPPLINSFFEVNSKNFVPLGLLTIVASLRKFGFNAEIYIPKQRIIYSNDYQSVAKDILLYNPKFIGFSTWCISYPVSILVAEQIKKNAPKIPVIFGGPQASILSIETLKYFPFINFVLAGESDYSFPDLLKQLSKIQPNLEEIQGLVYRDEAGKLKKNPIAKTCIKLNDLPIPAYDLIIDKYSVSLDVGRGCPFKCTYCTTSDFFSKKYRVKSVERILTEMEFVFKNLKIIKFSFAHDMFTLNKKFINELCTNLVQLKKLNNIEYTWTCSARIDCVDKDMLQKMKDAGCESIFFGIESGSGKIQKSICKNLNINKAYEIADICREAGINMHASFITGFPDESKTDIEKTLKCIFNLALKGSFVQISELSFLPGTPLFEKHKNSLKLDGLFSNFSGTICGEEELRIIHEFPMVFSSFYYLPVKILSHGEMFFLCNLVNKLSDFRNTIFLLKNIVEVDIKSVNLLKLFKEEYNKLHSKELLHLPAASFWVKIIRNYILKNKSRINHTEIYDVFSFEAFQSLLLAKYNRWHLINSKSKTVSNSDIAFIKPTPLWNLLTTSYKLNKIIPAENNWATSISRKKGKYKWLIIAVSEEKCKLFKINKTEEFLLNNLDEITIKEYTEKVSSAEQTNYIKNWLRKMEKLGVLEIGPLNKTQVSNLI